MAKAGYVLGSKIRANDAAQGLSSGRAPARAGPARGAEPELRGQVDEARSLVARKRGLGMSVEADAFSPRRASRRRTASPRC
jgi:hypothetical protein